MTTPQRLYDEAVMNYEGARAELDAAIKRLGYSEGFEAGREFGRGEKDVAPRKLAMTATLQKVYGEEDALKGIAESFVSEPPKEKTAQELRDEIVERAKADAVTLPYALSLTADDFEIFVNAEKKTVVAITKWADTGKVFAKGIAKCAPNDCFNAHIGKAIALRRALGLTVPDEYLNAPNPTEVRVGDVVTGFDSRSFYSPDKAFKITGIKIDGFDSGYTYEDCGTDWIERGQIGAIIDDSRE